MTMHYEDPRFEDLPKVPAGSADVQGMVHDTFITNTARPPSSQFVATCTCGEASGTCSRYALAHAWADSHIEKVLAQATAF